MKHIRNAKTLALALGVGLASAPAFATEGYFLGGYGPVQTGLAGAGVANSTDAMSMTLNPAGLVGLGNRMEMGVSAFMPERGYTGTGTQFVAPGSHDSSIQVFEMPNVAYSQPFDAVSSWGLAIYGNGGLNTVYNGVTNPNCPGGGVFCAGKVGVNVMQAFVQADYARQFGAFKLGVAPVFALQVFGAEGLGAFAPNSADPAALTNMSTQRSYGVGLHVGGEWRATDQFRIGVSGATPTWMTKLNRYAGLFADQGGFDIPAWVDAGVAYDVQPNLTLMADYKRIFYSDVNSIGDSSRIPQLFGTTGGPGFGWQDVNVAAFGAEWRMMPQLTLRAGVEFNTNPVRPADVTLNIVAPGVTTSQFSGGLSYHLSPAASFDFAGYYAPRSTVSGTEFAPVPNPGTVSIHLSEIQVTAGISVRFDDPSKPVKAAY